MIWYGLGAVSHLMSVRNDFTKLDFSRPQFALATDILSQLAAILFAGMIVALLFARRPATATAAGLGPRVAGILGTYLGVGFLLLPAPHISPWIRDVGIVFILSGMAFSMYALSYLGRSVSLIAEARKLVTGGPYSIVRHPLYLGEEIAILGVVLQYFSVWALLILVLQLLCQLYRMSYEEQVLGCRLPRLRRLQNPHFPPCSGDLLKSETSSLDLWPRLPGFSGSSHLRQGFSMSAPIKVSDSSFQNDVLGAKKPVVVDFWAEWCGPCRMISPALEELANELGDRVTVAKINIDENPHVPTKYGVRGIPTLMIFSPKAEGRGDEGRRAAEIQDQGMDRILDLIF